MDVVRDVAIIVLIVEGLVIGLAVFVIGVVGAVAIVEFTANVRRTLRRGQVTSERLLDRTEWIAETRILPSLIRYERARAIVGALIAEVLSLGDEDKTSSGRKTGRS